MYKNYFNSLDFVGIIIIIIIIMCRSTKSV